MMKNPIESRPSTFLINHSEADRPFMMHEGLF